MKKLIPALLSSLLLLVAYSCGDNEFDLTLLDGTTVKRLYTYEFLPTNAYINSMRGFTMAGKAYVAVRYSGAGEGMAILDENLKVLSSLPASRWGSDPNRAGFPRDPSWNVTGLVSSAVYSEIGAVISNSTNPTDINIRGVSLFRKELSDIRTLRKDAGYYNEIYTGFGPYLIKSPDPSVSELAFSTVSTNNRYATTIDISGDGPMNGTFSASSNTLLSGLNSATKSWYVDVSGNPVFIAVSTATQFLTCQSGFNLTGQSSAGPSPGYAFFSAVSNSTFNFGLPLFWIADGAFGNLTLPNPINFAGPSHANVMEMNIDLSKDGKVYGAGEYYHLIRVAGRGFIVPYPSGRDRYVGFDGKVQFIYDARTDKTRTDSPHRAYVSGSDYWYFYDDKAQALYKRKGWWL